VSEVLTRRCERMASCELEGFRACSACAGDYEDPDRTAWESEESRADDDETAPETATERFPAER